MVRHGNQALGRSHGNEAPGADKQDSSVDDLRRKLGKSNQGRDLRLPTEHVSQKSKKQQEEHISAQNFSRYVVNPDSSWTPIQKQNYN